MLQICFGQSSLKGPKIKYCKAYLQGLMALSGALGALLDLRLPNEPSKCLIQILLEKKTDKTEADKPVSDLK